MCLVVKCKKIVLCNSEVLEVITNFSYFKILEVGFDFDYCFLIIGTSWVSVLVILRED